MRKLFYRISNLAGLFTDEEIVQIARDIIKNENIKDSIITGHITLDDTDMSHYTRIHGIPGIYLKGSSVSEKKYVAEYQHFHNYFKDAYENKDKFPKDKIECVGEYRGLQYVIKFTTLGYRCGYVGMSYKRFLDKYIADHLDDIPCHGGITFNNTFIPNIVSHPLIKSGRIWIGFDCAHCDDIPSTNDFMRIYPEWLVPNNNYLKLIEASEHRMLNYGVGGTYKSLDFCINECKRIIDYITNDVETETDMLTKGVK